MPDIVHCANTVLMFVNSLFVVQSTLGIYQEINDTSAILPFFVLINVFIDFITQNKNFNNFRYIVYTLNKTAVSTIV